MYDTNAGEQAQRGGRPPGASVVIPTHNRRAILERVMGFYAAQTARRRDFELVVADDGSTDGTPELFASLGAPTPPGPDASAGPVLECREGWFEPGVRMPGLSGSERGPEVFVRYLRLGKSGRSVARNAAVRAASFPLILFADDDIFVEPEFVSKHLRAHRPGERKVVMGRVIHTADLDNPLAARWKPRDINTAFLSTGNASVPRDLLVEAGLFDQHYSVYGWEDFDLGVHLAELGVRSEKRSILGYHYDPPARDIRPGEVYGKEKERGMSAVYFYRSHPLPWVKRFTLVRSRVIRGLFQVLGSGNWFLKKDRIRFLRGPALLIVRYKGYFDGICEALNKEAEEGGDG